MAFRRRARLAAACALVLATALAAYWYFSPYLAIRKLHAAAEAGDLGTINEHVDYARLRASLKAQLGDAMAGSMRETEGHPLASAGAAVGRMMIAGVVEALVQPPVLMYSIRTGLARPRPAGAPPPAAGASPEAPATAKARGRSPMWRAERLGANRVVFHPVDGQRDDSAGLVLDRYGFATWKLTGMQLHLPSSRPAGAGS